MAHCIYSHYLKYICGKHLAFLDSCHDGLIWQVRNNDKHLTFVNNSGGYLGITHLLQSPAAEYLLEPSNSAPTAMSRFIKPPVGHSKFYKPDGKLGVNEKLMAAWHRQPHHTDNITSTVRTSPNPHAARLHGLLLLQELIRIQIYWFESLPPIILGTDTKSSATRANSPKITGRPSDEDRAQGQTWWRGWTVWQGMNGGGGLPDWKEGWRYGHERARRIGQNTQCSTSKQTALISVLFVKRQKPRPWTLGEAQQQWKTLF